MVEAAVELAVVVLAVEDVLLAVDVPLVELSVEPLSREANAASRLREPNWPLTEAEVVALVLSLVELLAAAAELPLELEDVLPITLLRSATRVARSFSIFEASSVSEAVEVELVLEDDVDALVEAVEDAVAAAVVASVVGAEPS